MRKKVLGLTKIINVGILFMMFRLLVLAKRKYTTGKPY